MDCTICFETYNNSERKPIVLNPCGHSFCNSCLQHLLTQCPSCRTLIETKIINYALLNILQQQQNNEINIPNNSNHLSLVQEAKNETCCYNCNKLIKPPLTVLIFDNKSYHENCLNCIECKQSLNGKYFYRNNNNNGLTCNECKLKSLPICTKCKKKFQLGESYKKINDSLYYHNNCFKCAVSSCNKVLVNEYYPANEKNKFFCLDCFNAKNSVPCSACKKPISLFNVSHVSFENKK